MINSFFLKQIRCNLFDKILTIFFWNQQHLFKHQKDLIFGALSVSCVNSVLLFSGQERASVFVIAVDHDIISYIDAFFLTTAYENLYCEEKKGKCASQYKKQIKNNCNNSCKGIFTTRHKTASYSRYECNFKSKIIKSPQHMLPL